MEEPSGRTDPERLEFERVQLRGLEEAEVWPPGGSDTDGNDARSALFRYLIDHGATAERITDALASGDLQGLGFDLLVEHGELTIGELAEAVDMAEDDLCLLYRHLGVELTDPDAVVFDRDEAEFIRRLRRTIAVFPPEASDEILQAMSAAMSSLAAASIGAFVATVEPRLADAADEFVWARTITDIGSEALELVSGMRGLFRHHLRIAIAQQRSSMRNLASRQLSELAVGFVDLVGYTSTTSEMDLEELVSFTSRFRHRAHDVVTAEGGRLVKHIGDEVMFSAVEPSRGCRIGLGLIDAFRESVSLPRGGIAHGALVARHGDLYGPVVNLASRLADIAVPGELLAPASLGDVGPLEGISLQPAGRRQLKGFASPVEVVSVQ